MEPQQEKKNKRIAFWVTLGIHGALLLFFILVMAWRAPDPPIPEYGIMVDFGTSTTGSGTEPVPSPSPVTTPDPTPQQSPEPTPDPQPQEVVQSEAQPTPEPVSQVESPDVVPEQSPKPTPQPEVQEEPTPEPPKPEIDRRAVMGPQSGGGGGSQGDDANPSGDKGQEDGGQSETYTGPAGGGNGDGLDIPGWEWSRKPSEPQISATSGFVKFKIVSDRYGNITQVEVVNGTLSPSDERTLREAMKTGKLRPEQGRNPSAGGVGYFTWRIKTSG